MFRMMRVPIGGLFAVPIRRGARWNRLTESNKLFE